MKIFLQKLSMQFMLLALLMPIISLTLVSPVMAQEDFTSDDYFQISGPESEGGEASLGDVVKLGQEDPRTVIANVINVILGFLGLIAVIIILAGGFKWMTAGGNQDKVDEAKKLITAGIIGLVIILASFGIATFIINSLASATGVGS